MEVETRHPSLFFVVQFCYLAAIKIAKNVSNHEKWELFLRVREQNLFELNTWLGIACPVMWLLQMGTL